MKGSLRYLNNAKDILKSIPVENGTYIDIKPVREACGIAYLSVKIVSGVKQGGIPDTILTDIQSLEFFFATSLNLNLV